MEETKRKGWKGIGEYAAMGGLARAKKLSAKRRTEIARLGGRAKGVLTKQA